MLESPSNASSESEAQSQRSRRKSTSGWPLGGPLCSLCLDIEFDEMFRSKAHTYSSTIRSTAHILAHRTECVFCQLTIHAMPAPELWDGESSPKRWVITRGEISGYLHWNTWDHPRHLGDILRAFPTCTIALEVLDKPRRPNQFLSTKARYRLQLVADEYSRHPGRTLNSTYLRYPESAGLYPSFKQEDQAVLDYVPLNVFCARPIEPFVDFELLRGWLTRCQATHAHSCKSRLLGDDLRDAFQFRVIDIKRDCIVDAPRSCEHVCLSYVWGQAKQVKLTADTQADLRAVGGLADGRINLPKTFREAIILCRQLGLPYLWIDAICILQDDPHDTLAHIAHMDAIYSSAVLTIVCAAGPDVNAGLPGVATPRTVDQTTQLVKGYELITCPLLPTFAIQESRWRNRTWTFQEERLSCRMLGFLPDQAYFWCQGTIFDLPVHEATVNDCDGGRDCIPQMIDKPPKDGKPYELGRSRLGDLFSYIDMVENYTARNLTYDSDILFAFSGMMACFRKQLDGVPTDWLFGMPIAAFGWSLCWESGMPRPSRPGDTTWSATPAPTARRPGFPSWSWAGWKTQVCLSVHHSPDVHYRSGGLFTVSDAHRASGILEERRLDAIMHQKHGFWVSPRGEGADTVDKERGVLSFKTSYAQLRVARDLSEAEQCGDPNRMRYKITLPDDEQQCLGFIALDETWRNRAPDLLDFIVIHSIGEQRGIRRRRARDARASGSESPMERSPYRGSLDSNAEPSTSVPSDSGEPAQIAGGEDSGTSLSSLSPKMKTMSLCDTDDDVSPPSSERRSQSLPTSEQRSEIRDASDIVKRGDSPDYMPSYSTDGFDDGRLFLPPGMSVEPIDPMENEERDDGVSDVKLYIMCIDWQGDVAYRVQMAGGDLSDDSWIKANPVEKFIRLG